MKDKIKIGAAQIDPVLMDVEKNLSKISNYIGVAAQHQADLIVFPECALSGYMFNSREQANLYAETIPGPSTETISRICAKLKVYVIMGMLEKELDSIYNTAVFIGPPGVIGRYRKVHLPYLGVDRYTDRGNEPFKVFTTPIGNIGIFICYDVNFPESSRSMTLQGADILVLPTNWPEGRLKIPKYVVITRAFENKVFLVACDRVGEENGTSFLGLSKIINVWGDTLAEAGNKAEEIIYADIDLRESRDKHVVLKPGEFEYDFIGDRRPNLYPKISEI